MHRTLYSITFCAIVSIVLIGTLVWMATQDVATADAITTTHSTQPFGQRLNSDGNLTIYPDPSIRLGSIGRATNLNTTYTMTTQSGSNAIAVDLDGWSAFSPFFANGQDWESENYQGLPTSEFTALRFWINRGDSAGGQAVHLRVGDALPGWE